MKKILIILLAVFYFGSLTTSAINVEFNTVNPNYVNNGFIQNTSIYQKKQNILFKGLSVCNSFCYFAKIFETYYI